MSEADLAKHDDAVIARIGGMVRRSELNALLNGKTFCCRIHGELMLKHWGDDMWLFRKHHDGKWVSMRKATDDDVAKIAELFTI